MEVPPKWVIILISSYNYVKHLAIQVALTILNCDLTVDVDSSPKAIL